MSRYIAMLLGLMIVGCTTSPAIRTPVNDSISIEKARQTKQTGKQVRWGGLIVDIENKSNYSIIEIVERPLTRYGVPKVTNKTGGRFLAKSEEFLEPENIKKGRYITVNGVLDEYQPGQIGDYEYEYPTLSINEYKVWPANKYRPHYRYHSFGYYGPYWWHHPYYFGHYRHHHHYW